MAASLKSSGTLSLGKCHARFQNATNNGTTFSKMEPESMRSKDQAYHDLFVVLLRGAALELDVTVFESH